MHPFAFVRRSLAAAVLLQAAAPAFADLMLFPTRVVFDKTQRAAQVELVNQGKTPETYRISLVNRRMGENGEFIAIESPGPGEQFADGMVRFSPRQVTIPPGSSQTVRIQLRKPADLPAGEYRSHLQFDRMPDPAGNSSVEALAGNAGSDIGVVLNALVGASIPVIVRHDETSARVSLAALALQPAAATGSETALAFQIQREGNRSVYGDVAVSFTPAGGTPQEVARAGGVAVYVPNPLRRARIPLTLPPGTPLAGGSLQVTYRERAEAGGRVLAEARLALP